METAKNSLKQTYEKRKDEDLILWKSKKEFELEKVHVAEQTRIDLEKKVKLMLLLKFNRNWILIKRNYPIAWRVN